MRNAILLATSALVLSRATVWAQQSPAPCRAEEVALQRSKVLLQDKAIPPEQLDAAKEAYAQCLAQQGQIAAIKAQEAATQAKLDEMHNFYNDSHPEIVALRGRLAELRSQVASLSQARQRAADASAALKRASGGLQTGLPDRWWKNAATAQALGLTGDQQKKMDDVFQQYRLRLIDLNASLEKEEVALEPLVAAEPLDESKIAAQIDRVAQARAELEKANGRMLLGIRKQLTPDQWSKVDQWSK
jgi:Spy/CpxP family protein refolding chaperone